MPGNAGVDVGPRQLRMLSARVPNRQRFADILGVNRSTISRMLSGRERPSRALLEKVCDALDLRVQVKTLVTLQPKAAPRSRSKWDCEKA